MKLTLSVGTDAFACFEVYKSAEAIQAHLENPGVKALFAEVAKGDLLLGAPSIVDGLAEF